MDSVLSMLGLAYRARKVCLGDGVLENLGRITYLFIASDASDKTKERFLKKCSYYQIPYNLNYPGSSLSKALGRNNVKIAGLCDQGFAKSLIDKEGSNNGKTNR